MLVIVTLDIVVVPRVEKLWELISDFDSTGTITCYTPLLVSAAPSPVCPSISSHYYSPPMSALPPVYLSIYFNSFLGPFPL